MAASPVFIGTWAAPLEAGDQLQLDLTASKSEPRTVASSIRFDERASETRAAWKWEISVSTSLITSESGSGSLGQLQPDRRCLPAAAHTHGRGSTRCLSLQDGQLFAENHRCCASRECF